MKVKLLRHRTKKGYHGLLLSGVLYRTGTGVVPQLFPEHVDENWIKKSIKSIDTPYVKSIDDFNLVEATLLID